MGILPIPRSLRKHLMVNGLYKVLLRFIFHLPFSAFFLRNSLILKYSEGWKIHLLSSSLRFYLPAGVSVSAMSPCSGSPGLSGEP